MRAVVVAIATAARLGWGLGRPVVGVEPGKAQAWGGVVLSTPKSNLPLRASVRDLADLTPVRPGPVADEINSRL